MTLLVGATQLRCRVVAVNRDEAALQPITAPKATAPFQIDLGATGRP